MKYPTIKAELDGNFRKRRATNIPLIFSYDRLGWEKEAKRVERCGSELEFLTALSTGDTHKLHKANFCKDRLCAMCAWRRNMKIFGQVSKIMDKIEDQYAFLFLTLTMRNCSADELPDRVGQIIKGFQEMMRSADGKRAFKGYFRSLEITHNHDNLPSMVYHPHMHAIVAVNKSYFHDARAYVSKNKLIAMWRTKCGLDYDPSVHINTIRPKPEKEDPSERTDAAIEKDMEKSKYTIKGAVCEAAKYTVKTAQFQYETHDQIDETVMTYTESLGNRRVVDYGGIFKKIAAELKLDDMENGDLVNTDNEELRKDMAYVVERYEWGWGGYSKTNEYIYNPAEEKACQKTEKQEKRAAKAGRAANQRKIFREAMRTLREEKKQA